MEWYTELFNFGIEKDSDNVDTEDPDFNLVPNLISKVVVPKVCKYFTFIFRPQDANMENRATDLVKFLLTYLEESDTFLPQLGKAILIALEGRYEELKDEMSKKGIGSVSVPFAEEYVAFFSQIMRWKNILNLDAILRIAVDQVLGIKLLPSLNGLSEQNQQQEFVFNCLRNVSLFFFFFAKKLRPIKKKNNKTDCARNSRTVAGKSKREAWPAFPVFHNICKQT